MRHLARVDAAVEASLGNAGLLGAWSPLNSLTPPGASAKSYLDLDAYTPFDISCCSCARTRPSAKADVFT